MGGYTRSMTRRVLLLAMLSAGAALAVDFSGAWDAEVELDAGGGVASFVFHQDGNKLTGQYTGMLGHAKLTGTVEGTKISWSFTSTAEGMGEMKVTYTGQLKQDGSIEGRCTYGQLGTGTFKASRKNETNRAFCSHRAQRSRAACAARGPVRFAFHRAQRSRAACAARGPVRFAFHRA
jgi:hypothetical protein